VAIAFSFVIPSYQLLAARYEAADGRLTGLLNLASTLTFSGVVLSRALRPDASMRSGWLALALVMFGGAVALGLIGRLHGALTLPDPGVHWRKMLH
jgi:hypothetical protein